MSTLLQRRWFSRRLPVPKRGPATRLTPVVAADASGLRFTEWVLLVALGLAYMFSISMPLFGIPLQVTSLKHLPLMILVPAVSLHLVGMLINRDRMDMGGVMKVCWPLLLMAIYVTVGALVGKEFFKTQDSFLTFGVYLFVLPLVAAVPALPGNPHRWVVASAAVWIIAAMAAIAGAAARLPATQSLHEIEYLMISAFVMLGYLARSRSVKLLALVLILAAAGLNHKLTGYIVAIMALLYIGLEYGWSRVDRKWRGFYAAVASISMVVVIGALALGYVEFRAVLPTGSPEVRLNQYQEAWRQFVESPVWGYAYTESSGEDFRESTRLYNIPTHSDTLDMLKHGGIIGFGLFAWGYINIFRVLSRAVAATRGDRLMRGYFLTMRFFQVSALVTFSLNPLLLKGPFLLVIWGNLGLAVGLALAALRRKSAPQ